MRRTTYAIALVALLAAAIAGCGRSSGGSGSEASAGSYGGESSSSKSAASGESASGQSGRYGYGNENSTASSGSEAGEEAIVSLGNTTELGMVLVDSKGMTLYDFHKDKGGKSACYGPCAQAWPPLITEGEPQVGNGASRSRLGTVERKDGSTQVTYAGHPLYTFVEDKKPGEANGNDVSAFGAQWYALKGSGEEAGG
ncbi:MAG TPA: hypothetical protein VFN82_07980 [Solirubrobacterales bacterium]|nr:hypothetical protein [Solirubrobacterales bacterium]